MYIKVDSSNIFEKYWSVEIHKTDEFKFINVFSCSNFSQLVDFGCCDKSPLQIHELKYRKILNMTVTWCTLRYQISVVT